ncbi:MAG: glycosidase [Polyangiales bacterium]
MIELERFPHNPIITPAQIRFTDASGTFNPAAVVDHKSGRVVLLVRVYEQPVGRSCLGLALSADGIHIDEVWDRPAVLRDQPYEEWGVEDARVTFIEAESRYVITYTGYSSAGPRVCLITTDDILDPRRYRKHGPRIEGDNKNTVIFPERINNRYVILHRPMPRIVLTDTESLETSWPNGGVRLVGPRPATWRSSRVGAGAPPIRTRIGWLLPIHGATSIEEGNVYSMGWCVLEANDPKRVRYVSKTPALSPTAPYEHQLEPIPQVDMANFKTGIHVVFPEGMVERGEDLIIYYGAADVSIGGARVNKNALIDALEEEIAKGEGGSPL